MPAERATARTPGASGSAETRPPVPSPAPAGTGTPQFARLEPRVPPRTWPQVTVLAVLAVVTSVAVGVAAERWSAPAAAAVALLGLLAVLALSAHRERRAAAHPIAALQRELDHSRRGHAQLFSSVPSFICVLNREHHVIEANEFYRREFDLSDSHFCYEICKRRTKQCANCLVDRTFEDGESHSSEETLVTRGGRRIDVVVHTQPVYDSDGTVRAVMEVFTDVTEVKRLQRQLALIGRAVAGMAHRVKNILMGLEGGIFIVNDALERDDREAVTQGWEMVERNVHLVSGIVKDLLFCAKDREPRFQQNVCPQDIVAEVHELYQRRVADSSIELRLELSGERSCGTYDPDGIHNLLCNLVANAIDACRFDPCPDKESHTVVMRCIANGDSSIVLEVQDDGAGIPEDLSHRVFQEFFSSKGTEGTGIGLLVVQKVTEEHGGRVSFESKPGHGTLFSVVLPASDTASLSHEGASPRLTTDA